MPTAAVYGAVGTGFTAGAGCSTVFGDGDRPCRVLRIDGPSGPVKSDALPTTPQAPPKSYQGSFSASMNISTGLPFFCDGRHVYHSGQLTVVSHRLTAFTSHPRLIAYATRTRLLERPQEGDARREEVLASLECDRRLEVKRLRVLLAPRLRPTLRLVGILSDQRIVAGVRLE